MADVDSGIVERIESPLSSAIQLKRWWEDANASNAYAQPFGLTRTFNDSSTGMGFFDVAAIDNCDIPVMGEVEDLLFDHPKSSSMNLYRRQLREFALRYMMRISDFRRPQAYVEPGAIEVSRVLAALSWCPDAVPVHAGFGYSQWLYKLRSTGEVGEFPVDRRFEIVDLREIGSKYEWIVVRVQIYNFAFDLRPLGNDAPQVHVPLNEESALVLSRDFIVDDSRTVVEPDGRRVVGRYGFGYAFVKEPPGNLLAYGPGEFDAAFQQIHFRIYEDGETRAQLAFVANRPTQITNVPIAPLDWPIRLANAATFGVGGALLNPLSDVVAGLTAPLGRFDPVAAYVDLANVVTAGWAANHLCIAREQLEKAFLIQHFRQHYDMITGALLTWRRIADWTDDSALPDWVRTGVC